MRIITFVASLLAFSLFASEVFAYTGGLNYYLRAFNDKFQCTPNCDSTLKTTVQVQTVDTNPPAESPGILPNQFAIPSNGSLVNFSLGRIEYPVDFSGSASYSTAILVHVIDGKLGETDCLFEFDIGVYFKAAGSEARVLRATANGIDSSAFHPGVSKERCQVYPFALQGPSLEIQSRSGFTKKLPAPSRLDP
jgi:hypothetical protein